MKHFGDISKLDGSNLPIVDIITGGSPCQDLSVAGKRAGLDGERSGLFMEQIRIVKEMRNECIRQLSMRGSDDDIRPRYMVWENVPGAFSSNKGEDFRCVLEEIAKVADENAAIPGLTGGAKWSNAGLILGDGYSIAWRLHDLQYFGCPQRRKRICVLADFNGDTAGKILFELQRETSDGDTEQVVGDIGNQPRSEVSVVGEGLPGNTQQSEQTGQEIAGTVGESVDKTSYTLKVRGGCERDSNGKSAGKGALVQTELSGTLGVSQDQTLITTEPILLESNQNHATVQTDGVSTALPASMGMGGGYVPMVTDKCLTSSDGEIAGTLDANYYKGCGVRRDRERTIVLEDNGQRDSHKGDGYKESEQMYTLNTVEQHAVCIGNGQYMQTGMHDKVGALNCMHDQQAVMCYGLDRASFNQGKNAQFDFSVEEELAPSIVARGPGGVLKTQ